MIIIIIIIIIIIENITVWITFISRNIKFRFVKEISAAYAAITWRFLSQENFANWLHRVKERSRQDFTGKFYAGSCVFQDNHCLQFSHFHSENRLKLDISFIPRSVAIVLMTTMPWAFTLSLERPAHHHLS